MYILYIRSEAIEFKCWNLFQLVRNGSPSRLVPSLDGGLYHVGEKGIEPVPLSADAMLSSSFRFTDDSMILGAKAIESYGINLSTGKVIWHLLFKFVRSFGKIHFFFYPVPMNLDYVILFTVH